MRSDTMILHCDPMPPRQPPHLVEARERYEAQLRALQRMGFHDPLRLLGPAPGLATPGPAVAGEAEAGPANLRPAA